MVLTSADGPFTADKLLQVAYDYYPRITDADYVSSEQWHRNLQNAPEMHARWDVIQRGYKNRQPWNTFVKAMQARWPARVVGNDTFYRVPAYRLLVGLGPAPGYPEQRVVAELSMLAPVFHIYESWDNTDDESEPVKMRYVFSEAAAPIAEVLAKEIVERFEAERLDEKTASVTVPGILPIRTVDGEPALADTLFGASRW